MHLALSLAQSAPLFAAGGLILFFWILAILASIFWIWMLIDVLVSDMPPVDKLLWFLVVCFLHLLGAIIYYIVKRPSVHPRGAGHPVIT
ncbi:MAG TPA: PLDc N-terminal domain-containing protein [Tepidisphaeraceae bacterium]